MHIRPNINGTTAGHWFIHWTVYMLISLWSSPRVKADTRAQECTNIGFRTEWLMMAIQSANQEENFLVYMCVVCMWHQQSHYTARETPAKLHANNNTMKVKLNIWVRGKLREFPTGPTLRGYPYMKAYTLKHYVANILISQLHTCDIEFWPSQSAWLVTASLWNSSVLYQ